MTDEVKMCLACGKTRAEHQPSLTNHPFSDDGRLRTWDNALRELPPQLLQGPTTNEALCLARLVEVLLTKKVISRDEAIYITVGVMPEMAEDQ